MKKKQVIFSTSGGIDSSFCLTLFNHTNYKLTAFYMKNWIIKKKNKKNEEKNTIRILKNICKKYNISLKLINFVIQYWSKVFDKTLQILNNAETPNPDIICNKEIKFKIFLQYIKKIFKKIIIITGHYSKIITINNKQILCTAEDKKKDQTYFLYTLKQKNLKIIVFPLQNYLKKNIRLQAKKKNLKNFNKKDSTGICFIEEKKFINFLQQFIKTKQGFIINTKGLIIQKHIGFQFYTIGQRKNIMKNNIYIQKKPLYVIKKNKKNNLITLTSTNYLIKKNYIKLKQINLILKKLPYLKTNFMIGKIRSQQSNQKLLYYTKKNNKSLIYFYKKQQFSPNGQHCVFYLKNICLGGGNIFQ